MSILSDLLSQIGFGPAPPVAPALVDGGTSGKPVSCIFCNASAENGFKIAYEDESFLAFEDKRPASAVHYLVIPRKHIGSIRTLKSGDVQLVKDMEKIGHSVLDKFGVPPESDTRRLGFHIPPFNSVDHLHLHVQSLPYDSHKGTVEFYVSSGFAGYTKGFSWFVEVNQAIQILESNRRVGVMPS